ncbi:3-isopropylmalate dehydratase small subunit [Tetragenococcus muriaticus]|uniref:3-isopropylmalate dehydratase small subunit n=1 Tax=Tetragenococcus muriaticus TaxID=64642 RepID=UPI0004061227|nr:3-isopropylmalate dehydratase small subunit [Tetragenococcus muriaticus]GMA46035.1 3-isopropylmalate dehydratase small subunit [Tetragenococcus muriaticus]GMA47369.1 3-isopropylmalate dehydratase small subunit [Tetragenococcus muriaticus]
MEAFTIYQGKTVPFMNNNLDTDQIIPKTYLKRIEKTGFGQFLFDDWRYLEKRKPNPDFVLNDPQYSEATILLSGDNFGSGSSREHAVWAIKDYGFRVVIASSFGDIFYMNALKNGLLLITLPQETLQQLAALSPDDKVTIDLPHQKVISRKEEFSFSIDQSWKEKLIKGLDEIGTTLQNIDKIEAYEQTIPSYWK